MRHWATRPTLRAPNRALMRGKRLGATISPRFDEVGRSRRGSPGGGPAPFGPVAYKRHSVVEADEILRIAMNPL